MEFTSNDVFVTVLKSLTRFFNIERSPFSKQVKNCSSLTVVGVWMEDWLTEEVVDAEEGEWLVEWVERCGWRGEMEGWRKLVEVEEVCCSKNITELKSVCEWSCGLSFGHKIKIK